jgi:AcrR family transcriptional regulator
MEVFWTRGYEATSLDDLCAATFGSKRNLLLLTVGRYAELRVPNFAAALAGPLAVRDAIAALLGNSSIRSSRARAGAAASSETAPPNCPAVIARRSRGCDRVSGERKRLFTLPGACRGGRRTAARRRRECARPLSHCRISGTSINRQGESRPSCPRNHRGDHVAMPPLEPHERLFEVTIGVPTAAIGGDWHR